MDDDVVVCRCEEITAGEIREAIRHGATCVRGVKRRTRSGMGSCQGRTCEPLVARIIAAETGLPLERIGRDTVRPPVLPVPFGSLARGEDA